MQDFLTNRDNIEVIIGAVFALFSLLSAGDSSVRMGIARL